MNVSAKMKKMLSLLDKDGAKWALKHGTAVSVNGVEVLRIFGEDRLHEITEAGIPILPQEKMKMVRHKAICNDCNIEFWKVHLQLPKQKSIIVLAAKYVGLMSPTIVEVVVVIWKKEYGSSRHGESWLRRSDGGIL